MIALEAWRARGRSVTTPDGRLFVIDVGPRDDPAPVFVLHGFPTSSWDFGEAIEALSARRRVVALDFFGFGFSDKPPELGYSLFEQADAALAVARELAVKRAHLWAHDMGTSVATELLARRERRLLPLEVRSLVLMNGSIHIELSHLTVGQRVLKSPLGPLFAKLNNRTTFKAQLRRVFARPPTDDELEAMWDLVAREDGASRLPQVIGYIEERSRFRRRWIGALERFDRPALVAWGRQDPVAVLAIAEQLVREIPGCDMTLWNELGHYPQVEDPPRVLRDVEAFWDRVGR
jgi:pimeloyl-ACP methyl ester carboxylesterase